MRIVAVVAVAALCVASAAAQKDDGKGTAAAVERLERQRFEAMTKGDLATLGTLLADDLIYTHSNARLDTKQSWLEAMRTGATKYVSIQPSDLAVSVYGDAAIITGRADLALDSQGQRQQFSIRFTDVWIRRDGRWHMRAWQSTRIATP